MSLAKEEAEEEEDGGEGEEENDRQERSLFLKGRKRGREGEEPISLYASAEKAFAETDTLDNTDKLKMIEGYRFALCVPGMKLEEKKLTVLWFPSSMQSVS